MDCQNRPYQNSQNQLFRSSNEGQTWEVLEGLPEQGYYKPVFAANGHIYWIGQSDYYATTTPICCGESNESTETPCRFSESAETISQRLAKPDIRTIPASHQGVFNTGIMVEEGDYVCIVAEGSANIEFPNGTMWEVNPSGRIFLDSERKKYPSYNMGQLLILQGDKKYGCDEFDMKGEECENVFMQETLAKYLFFEDYGNYFIASRSGSLQLAINIKFSAKNKGEFRVKIYKVSKQEHIERNCFNKCPLREPRSVDDENFDSRDGKNNWQEDGTGDEDIEECYHGGNEDYRGRSKEVKGCQCVYDENGFLINDNNTMHDAKSMGTFDYGYYANPDDTWLHFILDVFPHILYFQKQDERYKPTPNTNTY